MHKRPYNGNELNYPDISKIKGIKELEMNYQIILNELDSYLKEHIFESQFNTTMVENSKFWKVRSLRVWGVEMYSIQKYFPETLRLLSGIDGVINIGFNLLEPKAVIKTHCGDTNAIIRCHLGLIIPEENNNCALKVNNEIRNWQQGKVIGFTDAYDHEAWNKTNQKRIIMLFDVLKPEFLTSKNKVCSIVLASLYIQQIANYFPKLYKVNPVLLYPISYPLAFLIRVLMPVRNKIKK
ncbi:MAG: aspartyl/asparaginyl beta-hydroxylase domain-containing protein [Burkholderiales bacterium]|nr:aspartyl/asparaginyl beta-hydroxylase domain-containing protein [Bacteroidia bacterium]